ncbi:MAG: uncharacterized protein JWO82_1870, partial [Akkermansiaceae bacterium]|nr:uncharacterized protein [Akkermansiaceae bacterium]
IFFWDDDLDPLDFEPRRFVELMRLNGLQMAQPSIVPLYRLAHAITSWNENLPAGINRANCLSERIVGRMTNFVEIMAPAFTRDAWLELYQYMSPLNASGWGYDYVPLGRRGIIDLMPVVHTRRVQSLNDEAMADIQDFLISNGLIAYQPADCGWVLEPIAGQVPASVYAELG